MMQEAVQSNLNEYSNVLNEQIFLQENGVSFSYSDSISYMERKDLISEYVKYLEIKNEKIEEASRNARNN